MLFEFSLALQLCMYSMFHNNGKLARSSTSVANIRSFNWSGVERVVHSLMKAVRVHEYELSIFSYKFFPIYLTLLCQLLSIVRTASASFYSENCVGCELANTI
jgi:hypothetical protein